MKRVSAKKMEANYHANRKSYTEFTGNMPRGKRRKAHDFCRDCREIRDS
nr:MAG TPA: hypothetical protein [Caudoviricetes sp.]